MQVTQLSNIGSLRDNPADRYSKLERANIYARFVLAAGRNDSQFLAHCFGSDFCRMVDSLIDFNLSENNKTLQDVDSIKFYECRGGRKTKTLISRIKFK